MTKKILITGGTGFIGYHLIKKCIEKNWKVTSLSSKKNKKNFRLIKKVKYIYCDISNFKKLKKKINGNFDYVVNLAGYVDHSNKTKTYRSHYIGCINLAKIFLGQDIKKFVQIGSCIEYGKSKSPQKENIKTRKTYSTYGAAKLKSTKKLLNFFNLYKFPITIVRFYLIYGPFQDINRVIPIVISNAIKNKSFNCSSGIQNRDFLYIADAVDSIMKILKSKNTDGEILNIGSGKPITIKKIILKICKIIGKGKPQFGKINFRKDEIIKLYPDVSKAKRLLKWKPKFELNSGLRKTIKYFKKKNNGQSQYNSKFS